MSSNLSMSLAFFALILLTIVAGSYSLFEKKRRVLIQTLSLGTLPSATQLYLDALSRATVQTKPLKVDAKLWAATVTAVIEQESAWGASLKPPGPAGVGDFASRWRENPPSQLIKTQAFQRDKSGRMLWEVLPPIIPPATVAGWGYGLGQHDWELGDRTWIESGAWADAPQNIMRTAEVLAKNFKVTQGDLTVAIAMYNDGNAALQGSEAGSVYASKVIALRNSYGLA